MKPGDTVTIYEDPLTCEKEEGEAELIEMISETRAKEFWHVRFISDNWRTTRWIKKGNDPIEDLRESHKYTDHSNEL